MHVILELCSDNYVYYILNNIEIFSVNAEAISKEIYKDKLFVYRGSVYLNGNVISEVCIVKKECIEIKLESRQETLKPKSIYCMIETNGTSFLINDVLKVNKDTTLQFKV